MQSKKTVKTPSKTKTTRPMTRTQPEFPTKTATNTATVHDLVGTALLILPKELRDIVGPSLLQSNAQELEAQEVLIIVREEGVVAYVRLPIFVMEMEEAAPETVGAGATLKPVAGPLTERLTQRLKRPTKAHDMVSVVKPAGKGGRHA